MLALEAVAIPTEVASASGPGNASVRVADEGPEATLVPAKAA